MFTLMVSDSHLMGCSAAASCLVYAPDVDSCSMAPTVPPATTKRTT